MSIWTAPLEVITAGLIAIGIMHAPPAHASYVPQGSSPGQMLTVPSNGQPSFDGGAIYNINASNITGSLPSSLGAYQSLYHQTTIDVATNPTTPTSIISSGYCNGVACSAITLKANTCRPGMAIAVVGGGTYATGGVTAPNFTGTVKLGSTTLGTGSAGALLAGGPNGFNYNFRIVFATCGAAAQVYMTGNLGFAASGGLTGGLYLNTGTTYKTVDTTVDEVLDILGSYDTSNAANNFKNIIVDAITEP